MPPKRPVRATPRPAPARPKPAAAFARRAVFEELESRLLMSADLDPLTHETLLAAPAPQGAEFRALADGGSAVTRTAAGAVQSTNEIVFVDARVPDRDRLLAGFTAQADGHSYEVVELDPRRDGIAQVTEVLRGRIQVDAVHFITHAVDGAVQLGATWLDARTLGANTAAVAGWGDSLKQDADILFYGCDLASGASGRALMQWIAELTRGDVAASTDATGAAQAGGDWDLEYQSGKIETITHTATSWLGLLAPTTLMQYDPGFAALDDAAYEIKNTQPWGQRFQYASGSGNYEVNKIELVLSRAFDAPPQTVTVSLRSSWNGAPLASANIASSALGTTEAWYSFDIGSVTLIDSQQYYIRVDTTGIEKIYLGVDSSGTAANTDLINSTGVPEPAKDAAFRIVQDVPNAVPTGSPAIIGTPQEDQTLTADTSAVSDPDGLGIFAYQWERSSDGGLSWTNIAGATSQNYTLSDPDVGKHVRVSVAYVDGGGTPEVVTSAGVGPVIGIPDDTLVVDTTSDVDDGDTSSIDALLANRGLDGFISLREAIIATNSTANISGPDRILFNIAGVGPHAIAVTSVLPTITDAVIIDGSSEPDFAGAPMIELSGALAGAAPGLALGGIGGSTVRGLVINRFGAGGIVVNLDSNGNSIAGNWIGIDSTGNQDLGNNGDGIRLSSSTNVVNGNVISGNAGAGIKIESSGSNNVVVGNYIGTNSAGTQLLLPSAIDGNSGAGVNILGATNTIGGSASGDGNVIAGNLYGVWIDQTAALGNVVQGNLIGTDRTGTGDLGNKQDGVRISGGARNNTIGGTGAFEGNLISGNNSDGVEIGGSNTSGNFVQGNLIGTRAGGSGPLQNNGSGVLIGGGATNNTVGGNTIAHNLQDGVTVKDPTTAGNTILGNSIVSNNGLGIDLEGTNGPTPNDGAGDVDTGANGLQNALQLYAAGINGATTTVYFSFASAPTTTFRVQFFASATQDPSGFGEGQRYLGEAIVGTDSAGVGTTWSALIGGGVVAGEYITATVTSFATNDTSEFSNAVMAQDRTISGTIYDDVNGDALVSGAEGTFTGARVDLYLDDADSAIDSGDIFLGSTTTGAGGTYTFTGLGNATYWVVVDSKSLGGPAVWAEQTYAVVGAAADAGFTAGIGALYGGRDAAIADDASSLTSAEHVTRAVIDGADAPGIDSGFSFSAIANERGDDFDNDALYARQQQGTLRQFILNSNATIGVQETANFSIAGAGVRTINVTGAALPAILDAVTLDAWTQGAGGYIGPPLIELNGSGAGGGQDGFLILVSANGSMVRGFAINRFGGDGLHVEADNTIIAGNYIGTDSSGGGTVAGNAGWGVHLLSSFNRVGGTGTGERNVIGGNALDGIRIDAPGSGNAIVGNYIGLDAAGAVPTANGGSGIWLAGSSGNTIGGTTAAARNVISGNVVDGITGIASSGNLIRGNYIGTNAAGDVAIGNGEDGVYLEDGSNNTIGGASAAARNVVSGNGWSGITLWGAGSGNVVQGNFIGTNATGGTDPLLGNLEQGILVATTGPTTIGGTVPDAGNRIAYNGWDGVEIRTGTGHSVLGNGIYGNGEIGIDLIGGVEDVLGSTANDTGDSDTGPNNLQNFPELTGAATNGTTVTIAGRLESIASTNYRIEFFADGAGGPRYLGALSPNLFIGVAGSATFVASLTTSVAVGETITATATNLTTGSTSEFSGPVIATTGFSISGTIFHDVDGNATVSVGEGVFAGVTSAVALYLDDGDNLIDSGDSFISAVDTNASGGYSFNNLAAGTYYVAANSRNLGAASVWAEQTYAVTGAATGNTFTTSPPGALYGGRERLGAGTSDNAAGSINTAEHINKIALAGGNVAGVDFGFSFNAITTNRDGDDDTGNPDRSIQGSLRQFIQNSNVISGTQTANFSINYAGGGGPQIINVAAALPTITGPVILDAAATQEGFTGTPIIELNGAGAGASASGLTLNGGGSTVRGFVINSFGQHGINISGGTGNTIVGNYIGTNAFGSAASANLGHGIRIASNGNFIGGTNSGDGNVISGNGSPGFDGIAVLGASGNVIQGNFIGTDAGGTFAIPNFEDGIWLNDASNTLIGGTAFGAGNVISGNGWWGIGLSGSGSDNVIQGNYIGTDAGGTNPLGNDRHGIHIGGTAVGTVVGGPGAGNTIAYNAWDGVAVTGGSGHSIVGNSIHSNVGVAAGTGHGVSVTSGTGNSILGNSIHSNAGLGIDLNKTLNAPDANDPGDGDGGANMRMNMPVIYSAVLAGGNVTVTGEACPGATVQLFVAAPDASGYGEGQTLLFEGTVSGAVPGTDDPTARQFSFSFAAGPVIAGDRLTATATDAGGNTSEFSFNEDVVANTAPVANDDVAIIAEDSGANAINVLANDSILPDAGETLTITGVTQGGNGTVAIVGGTTVTYTPNASFFGTDSFTYMIDDGNGGTATATVDVTVTPANDPPAASDDSTSVAEDSMANTIDVLANDSILPDAGETLTVTGVTSGANGTVAIVGGGSAVSYTPNADFFGADSFTYTIDDGNGGTATATVNVTVTPADDLPAASDDAYAALEDTPLVFGAPGVLASDTGLGDGPLTLTVVGAPVGGSVVLNNDGSFTFTPTLDFTGAASFQYQIEDADGDVAVGTVLITVSAVNDAPNGSDTTITTPEDTARVITVSHFGFNDVDFGDAMTDVRIDSISLPAGATLQLSGTDVVAGQIITVADISAGRLVFTPVPDANGAGYASFTFSVRDTGVPPGPLFDTEPNTITIDVAPVNDLPVITSDGGLASAALAVVENTTGVTTVAASDIDGQPLAFSIAGGLDAARFSIDAATGVLTFSAAPNFESPADSGADNVYDVIVRVDDGAGGSDTQALAITVTDSNDAPFVTGDAYTVAEDTALSIAGPGVLANDGDEDLDALTATLVAGPANGTVAFNADGSFVYTPNANFAGVDSFTYRVSDGAAVSADATVTIDVTPVNDAPTGANGTVLSAPAVAYVFTLADFGFSDVDGDALDHVRISALPTLGTLTVGGAAVALNQVVTAAEIASGDLQYLAPTGTSAADSFDFIVHDGTVYAGASNTMTIGFVLPPATPATPPPPPVATTPPVAPPAPPAPAPEPAPSAEPGAGTEQAATGGQHAGGGGAAAAPPTPTFAENAPVAAESAAGAPTAVASAAVAVSPTAVLGGTSSGVTASAGGLQADSRTAGEIEALQVRGQVIETEVKAALPEIAAVREEAFRQELDKLREEVQQEAVVETRVAASVFAVSTGLSVGYVLWLLRGGVLIASLLSSIPAWRLVDPLPVLGRVGAQDDEDDESLEEMVDTQPGREDAARGNEAPRGALRLLQAFRRSTK